jgi:hypothetical protein
VDRRNGPSHNTGKAVMKANLKSSGGETAVLAVAVLLMPSRTSGQSMRNDVRASSCSVYVSLRDEMATMFGRMVP